MAKYAYQVAKANFYTSNITTIAANTTYTTVSNPIEVLYAGSAYIQVLFTGANASSSGNVTFNFVARGDPAHSWPTATTFSIVGALSTNTAVIVDKLLDTSGWYDIKVLSIANGDATYALSTVNANLSYKS
jgi:hypothetical protein